MRISLIALVLVVSPLAGAQDESRVDAETCAKYAPFVAGIDDGFKGLRGEPMETPEGAPPGLRLFTASEGLFGYHQCIIADTGASFPEHRASALCMIGFDESRALASTVMVPLERHIIGECFTDLVEFDALPDGMPTPTDDVFWFRGPPSDGWIRQVAIGVASPAGGAGAVTIRFERVEALE